METHVLQESAASATMIRLPTSSTAPNATSQPWEGQPPISKTGSVKEQTLASLTVFSLLGKGLLWSASDVTSAINSRRRTLAQWRQSKSAWSPMTTKTISIVWPVGATNIQGSPFMTSVKLVSIPWRLTTVWPKTPSKPAIYAQRVTPGALTLKVASKMDQNKGTVVTKSMVQVAQRMDRTSAKTAISLEDTWLWKSVRRSY
jgi:hypothetical protein